MQNPGGSAALPASDPLQLIRQATMTRSAVTYSDGYYIFGKQKFHQSTKTAFKRSHQGKECYLLLYDASIMPSCLLSMKAVGTIPCAT